MKNNDTGSNKEEQKKKIRARYKGTDKGKIEVIPARPKYKLFEEAGVKRVCAYCRVSTDDPKQTSSYELQKNHYEDIIKENPGWELVGIFADEGISGTSLEHRESFNSMVAQCKEGKIDLIVTKSVSRFARNIVDCIRIVRELKSLTPPVGIFFEAEHIYTLEGTSEMILAVLSATAQEESRTKSEIMNISIEQRFSRGIFILTNLLGFRKDEEGNLVINEDEADTVRLCFFLFLAGYSTKDIAAILTELRRPRMHGKTEWDNGTVLNILRNEKHCGDVLARKTFTPSYLDHKSRKNRQDKPQYREKDHHQAIVPREVFVAVGKMIDSHRYMRANCPLPLLRVIESGFLKGYVPVHLCWTGFGAEEYLQASGLFAQSEDDALSSRHPSSGFQIARTQMFSTVQSPALRISNSVFKFTASCMQKFGDVEYVEVLFHATTKKIAVRPCSSNNPAAVHWGKQKNGRWQPWGKSSAAFAVPLFEIMGWDAARVYRICGTYHREGNAQLLVFELSEAESHRRKTQADSGAIAAPGTDMPFPSAWSESFGPNAEAVRQMEKAEAVLYANGKGIGQAAVLAPTGNDITQESMNGYLIAAETIMQKMRA